MGVLLDENPCMTQPQPIIHAHPSPLAAYEARLAAGQSTPDPAQRRVAERLEALFAHVQDSITIPSPSLWMRLLGRKVEAHPVGLYIYGSVGRGKSMLMDMFFACTPAQWPKRRIHFHAFMLDVHKRMHAFRQAGDAGDVLPRTVADIASEVRLLCLDEFQVTDVTDAMILARLFTGLFDAGVRVVMTSNRHPKDLYKGGLQREQFLKFVDVVTSRMELAELDSPTDYRLRQLAAMRSTYHYPLGAKADQFLLDSWNSLTGGERSYRLDIQVQGRILRVDKHNSGVAWLTFDELCIRALGAADYIELATLCHTLLLQGVPAMKIEDRNEAKRFVTLIDTLYEHKVKLIITADAPAEGLYPSGDGSFEFQRTVSRLHEMQSAKYLASAHMA